MEPDQEMISIDDLLNDLEQNNIDEVQFASMIKEFIKVIESLKFWTETINEEDNQELLEMGIEAMEDIMPEVDIKQLIREGHGEYKLIQQKCIARGLL